MLHKLQQFFFPHTCIICNGRSGLLQDLCEVCENDLSKMALPPEVYINSQYYQNLIALWQYAPPVDSLIMGIKFAHQLSYAKTLGEKLTQKLVEFYHDHPLPEAIIPIPLHQKRLQERGFNQALEIARPSVKKLGIPLDKFSVIRAKITQAQATLPAKARKANIEQAFLCQKILPYKHVAVIDDVITTGSTILEFCKLLRSFGVEKIDVWCVAKRV